MEDHLKVRSLLPENAIAKEQHYITNNSMFIF